MASKVFQQSQDDDEFGFSDGGERSVTESLLEEDVYEGVEKKLILKYTGAGDFSIRSTIKEKIWRNAVKAVDAEVLSVMRNDSVDAYLLSESSLFVFNDRVCLKTCGTTRIFNAVRVIAAQLTREVPEINLIWVMYSRPTYRFPERQLEGYNGGFEREVEMLRAVTAEATARSWKPVIHTTGAGITFHSATLYIQGELSKPLIEKRGVESVVCNQENLSMDLAMFNLDPSKMKHFFGQQENVLEDSCLRGFLPLDSPGLQIDDHNFEPCGYSLNALDGEYFWSIHVTPEAQYSYVSFETNHPSASAVCQKLKEFYMPRRATVLWTDEKRDNWVCCINNE